MNEATIAANPEYDCDTTCDVTGGDKGASAAHGSFDHAVLFLDPLHRKKAVQQRGGGAPGVKQYERAFNAKSMAALATAKAEMSETALDFLSKVLDMEQFPLARSEDSDINGETSRCFVESFNHAILQAGVRTTHFAAAFKALVKYKGERHRTPGAKAAACAGMCPLAIALKTEKANLVDSSLSRESPGLTK